MTTNERVYGRRRLLLNTGSYTIPVLLLFTPEAQHISLEKVSSVVLSWTESHLEEALFSSCEKVDDAACVTTTCSQVVDGFQVCIWVEKNDEDLLWSGWFVSKSSTSRTNDDHRIQIYPNSKRKLVVMVHE
jgi:hypothetical protein